MVPAEPFGDRKNGTTARERALSIAVRVQLHALPSDMFEFAIDRQLERCAQRLSASLSLVPRPVTYSKTARACKIFVVPADSISIKYHISLAVPNLGCEHAIAPSPFCGHRTARPTNLYSLTDFPPGTFVLPFSSAILAVALNPETGSALVRLTASRTARTIQKVILRVESRSDVLAHLAPAAHERPITLCVTDLYRWCVAFHPELSAPECPFTQDLTAPTYNPIPNQVLLASGSRA